MFHARSAESGATSRQLSMRPTVYRIKLIILTALQVRIDHGVVRLTEFNHNHPR